MHGRCRAGRSLIEFVDEVDLHGGMVVDLCLDMG